MILVLKSHLDFNSGLQITYLCNGVKMMVEIDVEDPGHVICGYHFGEVSQGQCHSSEVQQLL